MKKKLLVLLKILVLAGVMALSMKFIDFLNLKSNVKTMIGLILTVVLPIALTTLIYKKSTMKFTNLLERYIWISAGFAIIECVFERIIELNGTKIIETIIFAAIAEVLISILPSGIMAQIIVNMNKNQGEGCE